MYLKQTRSRIQYPCDYYLLYVVVVSMRILQLQAKNYSNEEDVQYY